MRQNKKTLSLLPILLAGSGLLATGNSYAGCSGTSDSWEAQFPAFLNKQVRIIIGSDAFSDGVNDQIKFGEYRSNGTVSVDCHRAPFSNKVQGYTDNTLHNIGNYVYESNIPGVGVIGAMTNDDIVFPIGMESALRTMDEFPTETLSEKYKIEPRATFAVKVYDKNRLPPAGPYVLNMAPFAAQMKYGLIIVANLQPGNTTITFVQASCQLPKPNIDVNLGSIAPGEINPTSDTRANFNIELTQCGKGIKVDYKFVNNAVAPSDNTILALDNIPNKAEGVGIQILSNNTPLKLNNPAGAGGTIEDYTTAVSEVATEGANVTIPLTARYKRLNDGVAVSSGAVQATANFEVHYH